MKEAKVLDIKKDQAQPVASEQKKSKRIFKPRFESVMPGHIVDVWRLVEHSLLEGKQTYPDTTEDSPEKIRSHLFQYMQMPGFAGLVAKVGSRTAGTILGHVQTRSYGRPSRFCFLWCLWIEPQYRKQGIGKLLIQEYSSRMKKAGIYHWESSVRADFGDEFKGLGAGSAEVLMKTLGGRI